jgi:hypothetical protein
VAKATLPGGSLAQQASRDAVTKRSKEEKEKHKKEKAERKKQKKEEKAKRKQEKREAKKRKREEQEAEEQKKKSEEGEEETPALPDAKKRKTSAAASSAADDSASVASSTQNPAASSKSATAASKSSKNKKAAAAAVSSTGSNEEEDGDDDEDAEPERKMPRWKPNLALFNEQLMPQKVDHLWGFYDSVDQVEQLIEFLDARGVRERVLKANLQKRLPRMTYLINKRAQQQRTVPVIPDGGRRSARTNSGLTNSYAAPSGGFLAPFEVYVNHLAKDK